MAQVTLGPSQDADFFSGRTRVIENGFCEWRSHWLHDWSLILTLGGRGAIVLGERRFESEPGEMTLIAPEHPNLDKYRDRLANTDALDAYREECAK